MTSNLLVWWILIIYAQDLVWSISIRTRFRWITLHIIILFFVFFPKIATPANFVMHSLWCLLAVNFVTRLYFFCCLQHSFTFSIGGASMRKKCKEMEDLRKQEECCQQRIIKANENLAAAEAELENLPPYEPPKDDQISNFSSQWLILSGGVGYDVSLSTYGRWRLEPLSIYGADFVVNCLESSFQVMVSLFLLSSNVLVYLSKKKKNHCIGARVSNGRLYV